MEPMVCADTLVILWTSSDRETALNMVFMYAKNSKLKKWWPKVRVVVWGPSANLLSHDLELQAEIEELKKAGVELLACKACADKYAVTKTLTDLGVSVIYMGEPLTTYLKSGCALLTV